MTDSCHLRKCRADMGKMAAINAELLEACEVSIDIIGHPDDISDEDNDFLMDLRKLVRRAKGKP